MVQVDGGGVNLSAGVAQEDEDVIMQQPQSVADDYEDDDDDANDDDSLVPLESQTMSRQARVARLGASNVKLCIQTTNRLREGGANKSELLAEVQGVLPPVVLCGGFRRPGPLPFSDHYPFRLQQRERLPWRVGIDEGTLVSTDCAVVSETSPCLACSRLEKNASLAKVVTRARDPELHLRTLPNVYLTSEQSQARYNHHRQQGEFTKSYLLAKDRKLVSLNRGISRAKRVVLLVSENKIPRVHEVLARQLRRGASSDAIIKQLEKAISGTYAASGNRDVAELDKAMLVLNLCPRLLKMLNVTDGFASKSSLQKDHKDEIPRFVTCVSEATEGIILRNFNAFVFSRPDVGDSFRCVWTIAIDGVACEEKIRPSPNDGMLRGICPCAKHKGIDLSPQRISDIELVRDSIGIEKGAVHMACEIVVVAMIPNRGIDYHPRLVCAIDVCKHEEVETNMQILETVLKVSRDQRPGSGDCSLGMEDEPEGRTRAGTGLDDPGSSPTARACSRKLSTNSSTSLSPRPIPLTRRDLRSLTLSGLCASSPSFAAKAVPTSLLTGAMLSTSLSASGHARTLSRRASPSP